MEIGETPIILTVCLFAFFRLCGIILSFKNVKVQTIAKDDPGNCMIPVNYIADVYIFKPEIGSILKGKKFVKLN